MKVALLLPFKNDLDILQYTLPKIPHELFDELIFLDTGSTDGSNDLIKKTFDNPHIIYDKITELNWGRWRTMLMNRAKDLGCDWVFMLDSDETLFKESYEKLIAYMKHEASTLYRLARVNFCAKGMWSQEFYPDWQARVMKLDAGYYYNDRLHAQPKLDGKIAEGQFLPEIQIFHFGWVRDPEKFTLKQLNYKRTQQGKPVLDKLPAGVKVRSSGHEKTGKLWLGLTP